MKTLLGLTVANLKGLVRDRAALFWTFFFPVMFVFLFGWISAAAATARSPSASSTRTTRRSRCRLEQAFAQVRC
jgi:hypothetical protein